MSSANIHARRKDDSFPGMMYWDRVKCHTMLRMDFKTDDLFIHFSLIILRLQEMVAIKTLEN